MEGFCALFFGYLALGFDEELFLRQFELHLFGSYCLYKVFWGNWVIMFLVIKFYCSERACVMITHRNEFKDCRQSKA